MRGNKTKRKQSDFKLIVVVCIIAFIMGGMLALGVNVALTGGIADWKAKFGKELAFDDKNQNMDEYDKLRHEFRVLAGLEE